MALFDRIRQRFRAIGRSDDDDDAADSNAEATSGDTRTEPLPRQPGPVRANSERIARGLRGDPGGKAPGWFDGPERRQLRFSEPADWTGRTTSSQRNGGFAGSSILGDGNYLSTRVLGAPDTREASVLGPADGEPARRGTVRQRRRRNRTRRSRTDRKRPVRRRKRSRRFRSALLRPSQKPLPDLAGLPLGIPKRGRVRPS